MNNEIFKNACIKKIGPIKKDFERIGQKIKEDTKSKKEPGS